MARDVAIALTLAMLVFLLVVRAPMIYFGFNSDPRGCLLTSQSLLETGTVDLNHYPAKVLQERRIVGHLEDGCYIGNSLLAMPVVACASWRGMDLLKEDQDRSLQCLLAGSTCALAAALVYAISRLFLPVVPAVLLTAGFSLGTSFASTMGTGYWNHNSCVMFELAALLLLLLDRKKMFAPLPGLLAVCLFWAYIARPMAILFVLATIVYLALRNPRCCFRMICWLLIQLGVFVAFSQAQYHSLLPPYFLGSRLVESRSGWQALYGMFLAPSRGLFVFSPSLLGVVIGCVVAIRRLGRDLFFCVIAGWICLHCCLLAWHMRIWWGGWCFGPRYLTDILPGFLALSLLWYDHLTISYSFRTRRILNVLAVLLIAASVWINTRQGLYNTATAKWNTNPDVNARPEALFDWRFPQFLASPERNKMRLAELTEKTSAVESQINANEHR